MSSKSTNNGPTTPADSARIPLVEEQVRVGVEAIESGKVHVQKRVETRSELIEQALVREEVEVERVAVGREVERTEPPRELDGVMIVPVYEEELVVRKRLILKEELHIRRHRTEHQETIPVTLRKEYVAVERQQTPPADDTQE